MPHLNTTVFQRLLLVATAIVAAAWFLTVPGFLKPSTFVALFGFLAGFVWVVHSTYMNAQPASSLAQSLHDADAAASIKRSPSGR